MTTATMSIQRPTAERVQPMGAMWFDWAMIVLCAWFIFGLYLDGWAHTHFPELETFFTPWHAVLYSGFLASAGLIGVASLRNRARGHTRALPSGYRLSLLGVLIFLAGGVGDMIWHVIFGIEVSVEALVSPTHLTLALGAGLIVSGPLRSAWRRDDAQREGWLALGPMLLSVALLLSVLAFFTHLTHPLGRPWAAAGNRPTSVVFALHAPDPLYVGGSIPSEAIAQIIGIASILLQAGLMIGVVLLLLRRWGSALPPGSLTLVFTVNALLMGFMKDQLTLVPAAVLAGAAGDVLLKLLRPSVGRPAALRFFAFVVPTVYFLLYFAALALTKGIWWSIPLWTGSIALAGIAGWLVSYLPVPPDAPGFASRAS